MPDLIVISANLMPLETLPADLRNEKIFSLRCAATYNEILAFSRNGTPKAVILDLDGLKGSPLGFIKELRGNGESKALFPILGAALRADRDSEVEYFKAGINLLLYKPLNPRDLQSALETVLGKRFRRFERKPLNKKFTLSFVGKTWQVTSGNINRECLVVSSEELPMLGTNVLVSSTGEDGLMLNHWAHCWRLHESGLVLRFLAPDEELLRRIDSLPGDKNASTSATLPKSPGKEPLSGLKKIGIALFLLLGLIGALAYAYFQTTQASRNFSQISENEAQKISPYFHSVSQFNKQGHLRWRVRLNASWTSLEEKKKSAEFEALKQKLPALKVELAAFETLEHVPVALYNKGSYFFEPVPSRKSEVSPIPMK